MQKISNLKTSATYSATTPHVVAPGTKNRCPNNGNDPTMFFTHVKGSHRETRQDSKVRDKPKNIRSTTEQSSRALPTVSYCAVAIGFISSLVGYPADMLLAIESLRSVVYAGGSVGLL